MKLDHFLLNDNAETSQTDIDEIVSDIGVLFNDTSKSTFGYKTTKKNHGVNEHNKSKPWFNRDCRKTRNLYYKTRLKNYENCVISLIYWIQMYVKAMVK